MKINKELTIQYYKKYEPCDCKYCLNYYKQIEECQKEVCEFLVSLGVNPLKPFELVFDEEENSITYIGCMYVVYGVVEDDYTKEFDGVKFQINKNNHPFTGIEEEHFVLDLGPITMPII